MLWAEENDGTHLRGCLSKTAPSILREKLFCLKLWQVKGFIETIIKIGLR